MIMKTLMLRIGFGVTILLHKSLLKLAFLQSILTKGAARPFNAATQRKAVTYQSSKVYRS